MVIFADMIFVVGMSFVFSIMAAPKMLKFTVDENMDVEEKILKVAEQKWKRKNVIKQDGYTISLPSAYVEDVRNIGEIEFI